MPKCYFKLPGIKAEKFDSLKKLYSQNFIHSSIPHHHKFYEEITISGQAADDNSKDE